MGKYLKIIKKLINKLKTDSGERKTGFVIGNTAGKFNSGNFYITPVRETKYLIYGGVIVKDVKTAIKIAELVDGYTDYIFVDAEKKVGKEYYGPNDVGNIEKAIRGKISKSKILTYKGNDLAVEAVDLLLNQIVADLGGSRVALIGLGNLGAKVALKLVERGAHIKAFRPDKNKLRDIVRGLNCIKSEHTLASIKTADSIDGACRGASILVACADKKFIIGIDAIKLMDRSKSPILVDVGKGCFAKEVTDEPKFTIYRIDVSLPQKHLFSAIIDTHSQYKGMMGRKVLNNGVNLVSLGLLGKNGEVIVDDIDNPKKIIGIADGNGALIGSDSKKFKAKANKLKKLLKIK